MYNKICGQRKGGKNAEKCGNGGKWGKMQKKMLFMRKNAQKMQNYAVGRPHKKSGKMWIIVTGKQIGRAHV